jgi:hypothetical protein
MAGEFTSPIDTMSAMQQRRNEMATKRSKRASKTSAARSKRKVRARATPTERRAQPKGVRWRATRGNRRRRIDAGAMVLPIRQLN